MLAFESVQMLMRADRSRALGVAGSKEREVRLIRKSAELGEAERLIVYPRPRDWKATSDYAARPKAPILNTG